jgi:glycine betaine/choline ABC-type transport system substrate-binding protein
MASLLHPLRLRSLAFLVVVFLFTLTACASNNNTSNNNSNNVNSTKNSNSNSSAPVSNATITITVGGKQDTESQLLTKMYVLLLHHAGFVVAEHANSSTNDAVFNALVSGNIDVSPAFTVTGLKELGLNSTGNAQLDYLQLRQGYEAKYHVTWLDPAPLNGKVYSSAPVVRDSTLKKAPQIATTLNKLAPVLTEQVSQQLQSEVVKDGKSVTAVATQFLQSKGLL